MSGQFITKTRTRLAAAERYGMSKGKLVSVILEPDGFEVRVPVGTLLSKAAAAAGRSVEMPCGGIGLCGKCRVLVSGDVTPPDTAEERLLGSESLADGVRLACRTKAIGNTRVVIPDESRSIVQKILSDSKLRDCCLNPGIRKIYCELSPPSLDDERAEFERLAEHLSEHGVGVRPNINVARTISSDLRSASYKVTAVICDDELIAVESGDTTQTIYGIAFDLGSTTVVGYLIDLTNSKELGVSAVMNPQMVYGDDLVGRISFATTHDDGRKTLQAAALDALNRIVQNVSKTAKVSAEHIYKASLVGNTCMTHLLLGIDVNSLGQSPYVPSMCADMTVPAREIGLKVNAEAKLTVLPNVAGFVGSDLVGVLLSNLWEDGGQVRLAVDIGTNGEMALMCAGKTYVCSAAAGPAFEGAGISCGMRGGPGAIDSVVIDDDVHFTTIMERKPIGLCGSGLVDAVAQMLDAGIVDEGGRLLSADDVGHLPSSLRDRLVTTPHGTSFVLAWKHESGTGKNLSLTHTDIRHLQLAKGSMHAAIQTLLKTAGLEDAQLDQILLAGAFGNYISVESAMRIGLIPAIDRRKVVSIGNAAGSGAKLALLCVNELQRARTIATSATHLELAVSPDYQMELMERMMFPGQSE